MKIVSAMSTRARLGQLITMAQSEPIRITRRGRNVAIVMSPDKLRRMAEAARGKVSAAAVRLHAESAKRWTSVYEALAR